MQSSDSQRDGDASLPQHLRRPSLPPPSGPLPPTPELTHQSPLRPAAGPSDRLIGRPFLPSSSLPLWTTSNTKRPDASHQSIRARGTTTVSYRPSTGSREWARHSRSASDFRRATVIDRRLVQEQEGPNKPVSPSYPSSATLQDSLGSSSSSSQRNVPLPLPPVPSTRNSGLDKTSSSYSSTKSGSTRSSQHRRSISQPIQNRLSGSIRRWFAPSGEVTPDVESGPEIADTDFRVAGHRRNASSIVPESKTFYSASSVDDSDVQVNTGESHPPGFVANFSRKQMKVITDSENDGSFHAPQSYLTDRAAGTAQSQFHTVPSPISNRTRTSSTGSGLEFGYVPFLTESGNSFQHAGTNRSNRGSQTSSRLGISAGVSTDDIVRDLRSLSRLSGLSHVSGGAAFIISEDGDGRDYIAATSSEFEPPLPVPRTGQQIPRIDSAVIFQGTTPPTDSDQGPSQRQPGNGNTGLKIGSQKVPAENMGDDRSESGIASYDSDANRHSSSSSEHSQKEIFGASVGIRQLTPGNMRIHPADQRYSHTYRVRQSSGDDPVLIPVYNFPAPGAFPNRNHLTLPNPNPAYSKHTRATDSLDIFDGMAPPSNDSSERLIPEHKTSFKHQPEVAHNAYGGNSPVSSDSREKYTRMGTTALMSGAGRTESQLDEGMSHTNKSRTEGSIADASDSIRSPQLLPNQLNRLTARDRFDEEHHNDIIEPISPRSSRDERERHAHIPDTGSSPRLFRANAAYSGDVIDIERWPDRFSRQQKIGRYLLVMCTFLPPLWLVLAAGGLDIFVNELTEGEIWSVGKREKQIGGWLGGTFFAALVVAIIVVGIIVM